MGQQLRKQFDIPLDATVILSVGELNKNKNHKIGIQALSELNNTSIYYVICGRGPLMEANKKLAKKLGVNEKVIFTGYRTDVADFYRMADVFLFPSFREGLPVALMEAMVSGLPVVCGKIRGCVDLVKNNNDGLFFDITNATECAKILLKAINMKYKISYVNKGNLIIQLSLNNISEKYKDIYNI